MLRQANAKEVLTQWLAVAVECLIPLRFARPVKLVSFFGCGVLYTKEQLKNTSLVLVGRLYLR